MEGVLSKLLLLILGLIKLNKCTDDFPKKPHIILVVADDLGFNDVPWHNPDVSAPTLDKLARSGVVLEQNYVLPICSPTRSAIMSGRYPFQIGRQHGIIWPLMPTGLSLSLPTIPQYLKPLGYATHAVGKWHLGFCNWAYTPTGRGFDSFKGYYTGAEDYFTHQRNWSGQYEAKQPSAKNKQHDQDATTEKDVDGDIDDPALSDPEFAYNGFDFRSNRESDFAAKGVYSTYEFASRVEEILDTSSPDEAKFIYLAFQSVHAPLQVPFNYTIPYKNIKNKNRRTYLGMVSAMDEALERIVKRLKSTGHYDNSVIIFTSDNGGPTAWGANNWPLRGNKTTLWEGGTRAAGFVHSPLLKNKGTSSKTLVHATDWLSTIVSLAGGAPPPSTNGIDQWGAINGVNGSIKREELVYNIDDQGKFSAAIRFKNYKLIVGDPGPGEWTPPPGTKVTKDLEYNHRDETKVKITPGSTNITEYMIENQIPGLHHVKNYGETDIDTKQNSKFYLNKVLIQLSKLERDIGFITELKEYCFSYPHICLKKYSNKFRKHFSTIISSKDFWKKFQYKFIFLNSLFNKWRKEEAKQKKNQRKRGVEKENVSKRFSFQNFHSTDSILESGLPIKLFDINDDPEERRNLVKSLPAVVKTMLHRLLDYQKKYVAPDNPPFDTKGDPKHFGGIWSPGWC